MDVGQPCGGVVGTADGDGSIERDDRRQVVFEEAVVERDDLLRAGGVIVCYSPAQGPD